MLPRSVTASPRLRDALAFGCGLLVILGCAEEGTPFAPVTCTQDSECASLVPEGQACELVARCDEAGFCAVDGRTVDCPAPACQIGACSPETGECAYTPAPDGDLCTDDDPCTSGDLCQGGACEPGPSPCAAAGPCETVACDPATGGCTTGRLPDFADCDDGLACTTGDVCLTGSCAGAPVVCSEPAAPCLVPACDPQTGECVTSAAADRTDCDDGDPCTVETVCNAGECRSGKPKCAAPEGGCDVATCDETGTCGLKPADDETPCEDGDLCTGGDRCQSGACVTGGPKCSTSDQPCVAIVCDPSDGGCLKQPQPGDCDDGNPCTSSDGCAAGVCKGAPVVCDGSTTCRPVVCTVAAAGCEVDTAPNGAPCDDGSPCSDHDDCQGGECVGQPHCPDDGSTCTLEACESETAACSTTVLDDGDACDDGNPCTGDGACADALCAPGPAVSCDDADPCTLDVCEATAGGCLNVATPEGAQCDDGDVCTAGETCTGGACIAGPGPACPPDDDPCTAESCVPGVGCTSEPVADGGGCDDGDACTTADVCTGGTCDGQVRVCTAGDCQVAGCDPATGCTSTPAADGLDCDDGTACTSGEACQAGVCAPATVVSCPPTGEPCLDAVCDPADGSCEVVTAPPRPCDDGSACTTDDQCAGGTCAGLAKVCPMSACETATCDPGSGTCLTTQTPDGGPCDVGQACRVPGTCQGGACSSTAVVCTDDGDPCTQAVCVDGVGCTAPPEPTGTPCDDGDLCTTTSACAGALGCSGLTDAVCASDGDPCTLDTCTPGAGCLYAVAPGVACDDGSACTTADTCTAAGQCTGSLVTCPDAGPGGCQTTACLPASGCVLVPRPDGVLCDDASACTTDDRCDEGQCTGLATPCPDPDGACLRATCEPASGACGSGPDVGASCDDGLDCTAGDACDTSASCAGAPVVCAAPSQACRVAQCDEAVGSCVTTVAGNGVACDDGLPCQTGDRCLDGTCRAGTTPRCVSSSPCRIASCAPATGACSETPRQDGTPCLDHDPCTAGETCLQGSCTPLATAACDDGDPCTADACDPELGCVGSAFEGPCDDGDACTTGDACAAGACSGAPKDCPSGGACLQPLCTAGVCSLGPRDEGAGCDDGEPCTSGDVCTGGSCAGGAVACPTPGPCQVATCVSGVGCVISPAPNGTACANDPCLTGRTCTAGVCGGGAAIVCPAGPCEVASCTAGTGCRTSPRDDGVVCDDGDACTGAGTCANGACEAPPIACPAGSCRVATCDPAVGCGQAIAGDGATCSDGNACTQGDACSGGSCVAGTPVTCSGTTCEPETCDPASGACVSSLAAAGIACDDSDPCTTSSVCDGGQCRGTPDVACPPSSDPCQLALCVASAGGCTFAPAPTGTGCDDQNACTSGDFCEEGQCAGVLDVVCAAPSGCVASVCEPGTGACSPTVLDDGAPCDDGSPCLSGSTCSGGACEVGPESCCSGAGECDDGDPGTADDCIGGRCRHLDSGHLIVAADTDGTLHLFLAGLGFVQVLAAKGVDLAANGKVVAARTELGRLETIAWDSTPLGALEAVERVGDVGDGFGVVRDGVVELRSAGLELVETLGPAPIGALRPIQGPGGAVLVPSDRGFVRWYRNGVNGDWPVGGALALAVVELHSGQLFAAGTGLVVLDLANGRRVSTSSGALAGLAADDGMAMFVAGTLGGLQRRASDTLTVLASRAFTDPVIGLDAAAGRVVVVSPGALRTFDAQLDPTGHVVGAWASAVWVRTSQ